VQWTYPIHDVHEASIRAERAEKSGFWHVAVQQNLYCLERSQNAQDHQAIRFFAWRLSNAYQAMKMSEKAALYLQLSSLFH
jgi:hypothetical protein